MINRAEHAGDPWSGHVAGPGGRAEPEDKDLEATAVLETLEEIEQRSVISISPAVCSDRRRAGRGDVA